MQPVEECGASGLVRKLHFGIAAGTAELAAAAILFVWNAQDHKG
jgi:hypothetical protein